MPGSMRVAGDLARARLWDGAPEQAHALRPDRHGPRGSGPATR